VPLDPESGRIQWRIHLASPPPAVYRMLTTDEGRARFWAGSTDKADGVVTFRFPNGLVWRARVLEKQPDESFSLDYFGSTVRFDLAPDGRGGTDLTLTDDGQPDDERAETAAGWVSVLMALKAAVDYSIDLRNHDPARTWDQGYADN
jgi:uncharacterized protein YndB with AHSA1/START domain